MSVYKARSNEERTDQTVRIFKSNGLLQGATVTLTAGTTNETRYDYTSVQAPASAQ